MDLLHSGIVTTILSVWSYNTPNNDSAMASVLLHTLICANEPAYSF